MSDTPDISLLKQSLLESNNIAVFGHRGIDGDAMWSCLAIGTVLEDMWKHVNYFTPKEKSKMFDFLEKSDRFELEFDWSEEYDLILIMDTADPVNLLKPFWVGHEEYFARKKTIVIDHHISNTRYGELNYVNDTASSACEYLCTLVREMDESRISAEVATYLFIGVSTDTWHLTFPNAVESTYETCQFLISRWAEAKRVITHLYRSNSFEYLTYMWVVWGRVKKQWHVISSYYLKPELEELWLDKEIGDMFLFTLTGVKHDGVFLYFKVETRALEFPPHMTISFRTKNLDINVWEIASHFNWGGHRAAAWGKVAIEWWWEKTIAQVIEKVNELVKHSYSIS